jgi:kinesin family protein 15
LRDSLGGNSKTLIIANISPSNQCHGETLSTLKFAQRAKLIKNKAVINEDSSGTIQLLKAEISRLKKDLAENEKIIRSVANG